MRVKFRSRVEFRSMSILVDSKLQVDSTFQVDMFLIVGALGRKHTCKYPNSDQFNLNYKEFSSSQLEIGRTQV